MGSLGLHRLMVTLYLSVFLVVIGINAYSEEVENLIKNGDFEDGLIEWNLRTDGGSVAAMEEDKKEAVKGRRCVFINIDNVAGTDAWHLSLYQEGHLIEKGETYTLAFWAKAEGIRPVVCYIEQMVDPWNEYGRGSFQVGEEWQEYWITMTATLSEAIWPRIALGESDVSIWVDNVRFYKGEYVEEEELGKEKAVYPAGKLSATWAGTKRCH